MKLEPGSNYLIDYGAFQKVATFLLHENENNVFFDINGKFIFSDSFLAKGSVKIEALNDD